MAKNENPTDARAVAALLAAAFALREIAQEACEVGDIHRVHRTVSRALALEALARRLENGWV
jgi:hypothetical protein